MLRFESAAPPLDQPRIGLRAARLLSRAELMGLLSQRAPVTRLDLPYLRRAVYQLTRRSGVGRGALLELRGTDDPTELERILERLGAALEESPVPASEWRPLIKVLGGELLADLVDVSPASLRRYAGGVRATPDEVAARLHALALVVADLGGAYNEIGIRRWFARPRSPLRGHSPRHLLRGAWDPHGAAAERVRALASSLVASPAT